VPELDGRRVVGRAPPGHQRHHRAEQHHRVQAHQRHLPRRRDEHAEHQDHHHDGKHAAAARAQQRVGEGTAGQRVDHLRHRQRRVGEAP
jgi:hypothetical protein